MTLSPYSFCWAWGKPWQARVGSEVFCAQACEPNKGGLLHLPAQLRYTGCCIEGKSILSGVLPVLEQSCMQQQLGSLPCLAAHQHELVHKSRPCMKFVQPQWHGGACWVQEPHKSLAVVRKTAERSVLYMYSGGANEEQDRTVTVHLC